MRFSRTNMRLAAARCRSLSRKIGVQTAEFSITAFCWRNADSRKSRTYERHNAEIRLELFNLSERDRVVERRRGGGALAGACGPTAQRAGDALWGGCARDRLAPAHRRPVAGAAARRAALAHRVWLVSQMAGARAVRPLAGGCGPPTPPRDGPPGQAPPEHHRHAVRQVHSGARSPWVRRC